jgi:lactoylglutathione lyase
MFEFLQKKLELPILLKIKDLVYFRLGSSYLMIKKKETKLQNLVPNCVRTHVSNVEAETKKLRNKGITTDYQKHDWGTMTKFKKPAGNLLALKDEDSFSKQITNCI